MPSQRQGELIRWEALEWARRGAMILMLLCFLGVAALLLRACLHRAEVGAHVSLSPNATAPPVGMSLRPGQATPAQAQGASIPAMTPPPFSQPEQTPASIPGPQPWPTKYPLVYVGVVAGHWQYDSGAVCPDGLREVDLTLPVAQRVAEILRWRGYQVDLLGEYDAALTDYRADAFISIHADSCDIPGASGFKVARVENSFVPEEEDRLVDCLWETYAAATGLAPHPASITPDMRHYHAFRKISPYTPGAIIEMGFMLDDRWLLENQPEEIATGIVEGVVCFLEGQ
jgi:N-acetylmuramoyl-L-alanine amidase